MSDRLFRSPRFTSCSYHVESTEVPGAGGHGTVRRRPSWIAAVALIFFSAASEAQSVDEVAAQYESICAPAQLSQHPAMRPQCDMLRTTLEGLRKVNSSTSSPGQAPSRSAPIGNAADGQTQCSCTRKLGRCTAAARVLSQDVRRVATGMSSRVTVRTEPPAGQCAEVTVFLQETAHFPTNVNRRGHPLYQVISGTNDVEWKNLSTGASRIEYSILSEATECYVCDAGKGGNTGVSTAADVAAAEQSAREAIRASYERQYRECLAGKGQLVSSLAPFLRPQFCAGFKEAMDKEPR